MFLTPGTAGGASVSAKQAPDWPRNNASSAPSSRPWSNPVSGYKGQRTPTAWRDCYWSRVTELDGIDAGPRPQATRCSRVVRSDRRLRGLDTVLGSGTKAPGDTHDRAVDDLVDDDRRGHRQDDRRRRSRTLDRPRPVSRAVHAQQFLESAGLRHRSSSSHRARCAQPSSREGTAATSGYDRRSGLGAEKLRPVAPGPPRGRSVSPLNKVSCAAPR